MGVERVEGRGEEMEEEDSEGKSEMEEGSIKDPRNVQEA